MPFSMADGTLRHRAAEDLIFENEPTPRASLENDIAVAKLTATASLFLVTALYLGTRRDGLLVRNLGWMQHYFHAVALLQLVDNVST